MSPYELKIKLDMSDDKAKFVKEHSMSRKMNVIVTDDGHMHFFDDEGNDITKSIIHIEDWAFYNCTRLKNITIPDSVANIGHAAFSWCTSLTGITIPDSVTSIGDWAFNFCKSLTSISMSNSVTSIEEAAFYNCINLTSIIIPDSVIYIGNWAFDYCANLKSIVFKGKTLEEVKRMKHYPWGAEDESVFKASDNVTQI